MFFFFDVMIGLCGIYSISCVFTVVFTVCSLCVHCALTVRSLPVHLLHGAQGRGWADQVHLSSPNKLKEATRPCLNQTGASGAFILLVAFSFTVSNMSRCPLHTSHLLAW